MISAPSVSERESTRLWAFYALAAASFLPALGFYYVGEEAILPISSLEMWYGGEWVRQLLFGNDLQHNPLFNWVLIGLCRLFGWEHMLAAARSISIGAVISTGLVLAWLARRVSGDALLGVLAALVYLMLSDIALYRGWLAYSDPLFAFFIFSATACLWVACRERRPWLLAAAVLLISAALLTKAFTAYVFYGTAAFVLLFDRAQRAFLLSWRSVALHAGGAFFVAAWFGLVLGGGGQGTRMFNEVIHKLRPVSFIDYAVKLLVFPLSAFVKTFPLLLLAAYYGIRRRHELDWRDPVLRTALAVALLGLLPYWLAPESHMRYLMPVYPWIALACACVIRRAGPGAVKMTMRWWWALLAVKLVLFLAIFPYYQKVYRGENYSTAAQDILRRAAGHPLYTTNDSASGLSVAAEIDVRRLPQPPLGWVPAQWENGFVIAYTPDPKLGRVAHRYRLGGNDLYLLCRGTACNR